MLDVKRLRCFIGWLAILLPWIVAGLSLIFGYSFPGSISMTYYRPECIVPFMIILGSASILLMYYNGYDKVDDILNTIAGILGLCICLFPCYPPVADLVKVGTFRIPAEVSMWIHNIVAILFFGVLSYISIFQFTKSSGEMTKQKKIRNIIYIVCGCGMLASFLLLVIPNFDIKIWVTEAVALFFFGISWLTKSDVYKWLAADPKEA
jgi:hypothetical protein